MVNCLIEYLKFTNNCWLWFTCNININLWHKLHQTYSEWFYYGENLFHILSNAYFSLKCFLFLMAKIVTLLFKKRLLSKITLLKFCMLLYKWKHSCVHFKYKLNMSLLSRANMHVYAFAQMHLCVNIVI